MRTRTLDLVSSNGDLNEIPKGAMIQMGTESGRQRSSECVCGFLSINTEYILLPMSI